MANAEAGPALELELPAVPESTSKPRFALRAFARRFVTDLNAVEVAVSEAVSNVVVHAYRDRTRDAGAQRLKVRATVDAESLYVSVSDDGLGFAPRADSPGGGFGLVLIATLASQLEIERLPNGTRVRMRCPRRTS